VIFWVRPPRPPVVDRYEETKKKKEFVRCTQIAVKGKERKVVGFKEEEEFTHRWLCIQHRMRRICIEEALRVPDFPFAAYSTATTAPLPPFSPYLYIQWSWAHEAQRVNSLRFLLERICGWLLEGKSDKTCRPLSSSSSSSSSSSNMRSTANGWRRLIFIEQPGAIKLRRQVPDGWCLYCGRMG